MHLSLPIPPDWSVQRRAGLRIAMVPGSETPDLLLAYGPLILLPDNQRAWVSEALRVEVGNARIEVTSDTTVKTDTGWPVRLVAAKVLGAEEGTVAEWRLCAFYAFFEHGATAMVRAKSLPRYEALNEQMTSILRAAVPDWGGEVAALSQLWDVSATPETEGGEVAAAADAAAEKPTGRLAREVADAGADAAALAAALERVDEALAKEPTARLHCIRGRTLAAQGDAEGALDAYRAAAALEPDFAEAHFSAGLALVSAGREEEAAEAWEAAAAADEADVDALFNLGQLRFNRGELEEARMAWQSALDRRPGDFWTLRKLVQALHGLGAHDRAHEMRDRLIAAWRSSREPRVRLADEYVFDQFAVDGETVYAFETLRPRNANAHDVLSFRVVFAGGAAAPLRVQVETSAYARERGTPFVLSVLDGKDYRVIGTTERIPPYPELKKTVSRLVGDVLTARRN